MKNGGYQEALCISCRNCSPLRCEWVRSGSATVPEGVLVEWRKVRWRGSKLNEIGTVIECPRYEKEGLAAAYRQKLKICEHGYAMLLEAVAETWQEDYLDAVRAMRAAHEMVDDAPDDETFAIGMRMVREAADRLRLLERDLREGLLAETVTDPASVMAAVREKA